MDRLILVRTSTSEQGTFGQLTAPNGAKFHTIELPWKQNQRRISCIPPGRYVCGWHASRKFGIVPILKGVPNRDAILIHKGNYAGDVSLGYKSDYLGCIGIGKGVASIPVGTKQQKMIISSAVACEEVFRQLRPSEFEILISEKFQ